MLVLDDQLHQAISKGSKGGDAPSLPTLQGSLVLDIPAIYFDFVKFIPLSIVNTSGRTTMAN